jgi:hypothetical protein
LYGLIWIKTSRKMTCFSKTEHNCTSLMNQLDERYAADSCTSPRSAAFTATSILSSSSETGSCDCALLKGELEMDEDVDETTDRETVVEAYLRRLELAGIEIDRRRNRKNNLQPTTAAGSDVQASAALTISSPESVPCCPNKAAAMSRIDLCTDGVRTKRSGRRPQAAISASTVKCRTQPSTNIRGTSDNRRDPSHR